MSAGSNRWADQLEHIDGFTLLNPKSITCRIVTCRNYNACISVGQSKRKNTVLLYNFGLDWRLPGHGDSYKDCGDWRARGCLKTELHQQNELYENVKNKIYVEFYHRNCGRAECPICYERWAALEAKKMECRLNCFTSRYGKISHVSVSPPDKDIEKLKFEELRSKAYKIAKSRGLKGGSVIWHPWRENEDGTWRVSPHFHFLSFGWIDFKKTELLQEKDGWVVHYIGDGKRERSISATAFYQLGHCGINGKKNPVSYWGVCGNSMAKKKGITIKKLEPEKHLCPCCKSELMQIAFLGPPDSLPDREEDTCFWLEPDGWYEEEKKNYLSKH